MEVDLPKKEEYKVIIPTARNVLDFITDSINTKIREQTDIEVSMPNLIQRAKLLVKKSGVLFLKTTRSNDSE